MSCPGCWRFSTGIAFLLIAATSGHASSQGVSSYAAGPDNDSTAVRVLVFPAPPYVERARSGQQLLNVDFRIQNRTAHTLSIRRILLSVLGDRDQVVHQQFVAVKTAMAPGINTIAKLSVGAHDELGVFNPFYSFEPGLPLTKLRYRFLFDVAGSARQYESTVIVSPVEYRPTTALTLPLKGRVLVYDGHDFYAHHRRIDASHPAVRAMHLTDIPVRFADDLCIVGENGELYRGSPETPRNWLGFGAPVYAPAAGRVVEAINDVPDNTVSHGRLVPPPHVAPGGSRQDEGNHVVIDHGNGEYSSLVHLEAGTVTVKVGDAVTQGQQIGKIGFSGDTGFHVHLHYNLTSSSQLTQARALPAYFHDFRRLLGARTVTVRLGMIDTGDVVESVR